MSALDVAERLRKRRAAEVFQTPEGDVFLRGLTGTERFEYIEKFTEKVQGNERLLADQHLVAMSLCADSTGVPLYKSFEDSLASVVEWQVEVTKAAAKKVCGLSNLGEDAEKEAEKK